MDEGTLESLQAALAATPANAALALVVAEALAERARQDEVRTLLEGFDPAELGGPDACRHAASLLLGAAAPDSALHFAECAGDAPEASILRARVLAALGRVEDARRAYRRGVTENATLEDKALESSLGTAGAQEYKTRGGQGPALRVIANDDTDETELVRLGSPDGHPVTFADVGGLDSVKRQIERRIIAPFKKPALFARFKKRVGGGILLYGPPGCGKTLLARATAGECEARFFNVAISDVLDMWMGESERKLHALFDQARQKPPAVLFFDELEALAGKRQYSRDGTASKLVSQFLSEMDGFSQNNHGVLVLAATNAPWAIDPAFRRPGRFDRVLFVPPPDREAREAILEILVADRPTHGTLRLRDLARRTSGMSGADLADVVETAADLAIERSIASGTESPIMGEDLVQSLSEVKPTTTEWLTTARNHARYANEAGQYDEVLEFLARHGKR